MTNISLYKMGILATWLETVSRKTSLVLKRLQPVGAMRITPLQGMNGVMTLAFFDSDLQAHRVLVYECDRRFTLTQAKAKQSTGDH